MSSSLLSLEEDLLLLPAEGAQSLFPVQVREQKRTIYEQAHVFAESLMHMNTEEDVRNMHEAAMHLAADQVAYQDMINSTSTPTSIGREHAIASALIDHASKMSDYVYGDYSLDPKAVGQELFKEIGSRGLWEKYHHHFIVDDTKKVKETGSRALVLYKSAKASAGDNEYKIPWNVHGISVSLFHAMTFIPNQKVKKGGPWVAAAQSHYTTIASDDPLKNKLEAFGLKPELTEWLHNELSVSAASNQPDQLLLPIGYNAKRNMYLNTPKCEKVIPKINTFDDGILAAMNLMRAATIKYTHKIVRAKTHTSKVNKRIRAMIQYLLDMRLTKDVTTELLFSPALVQDISKIADLALKKEKLEKKEETGEGSLTPSPTKRRTIIDPHEEKKRELKEKKARAEDEFYEKAYNSLSMFEDTLTLNILLTFVVPNMDCEFRVGMKQDFFGENNTFDESFAPYAYDILIKTIRKFFLSARQVPRHWLQAITFVMYAVIETMGTIMPPLPGGDYFYRAGQYQNEVMMAYAIRFGNIKSKLFTSDPTEQRMAFQLASRRILGGRWNRYIIPVEPEEEEEEEEEETTIQFSFENRINTDVIIGQLDRFLQKNKEQSKLDLRLVALLKVLEGVETALVRGDWNFEEPAWFFNPIPISTKTGKPVRNNEQIIFEFANTAFSGEDKKTLILARAKYATIPDKIRVGLLARIMLKVEKYNIRQRSVETAVKNGTRTGRPHSGLTAKQAVLMASTYALTAEEKTIFAMGDILSVSVEDRRRLIWNLSIALVHMARGGTFGKMVVKNFHKYRTNIKETHPPKGWKVSSTLSMNARNNMRYAMRANGPTYTAPTEKNTIQSLELFEPKWKNVDPKNPKWATNEDWLGLKPKQFTNRQWNMLRRDEIISDQTWLDQKPQRITDAIWLKGKPDNVTKEVWGYIKPRGAGANHWMNGKPSKFSRNMWLGLKPNRITDRRWLQLKPKLTTDEQKAMLLGPIEISDNKWLSIKPANETNISWMRQKRVSFTDHQWQEITEKARESMELTSWEKTLVAYVAIFLFYGEDSKAMDLEAVLSWQEFADVFLPLPSSSSSSTTTTTTTSGTKMAFLPIAANGDEDSDTDEDTDVPKASTIFSTLLVPLPTTLKDEIDTLFRRLKTMYNLGQNPAAKLDYVVSGISRLLERFSFAEIIQEMSGKRVFTIPENPRKRTREMDIDNGFYYMIVKLYENMTKKPFLKTYIRDWNAPVRPKYVMHIWFNVFYVLYLPSRQRRDFWKHETTQFFITVLTAYFTPPNTLYNLPTKSQLLDVKKITSEMIITIAGRQTTSVEDRTKLRAVFRLMENHAALRSTPVPVPQDIIIPDISPVNPIPGHSAPPLSVSPPRIQPQQQRRPRSLNPNQRKLARILQPRRQQQQKGRPSSLDQKELDKKQTQTQRKLKQTQFKVILTALLDEVKSFRAQSRSSASILNLFIQKISESTDTFKAGFVFYWVRNRIQIYTQIIKEYTNMTTPPFLTVERAPVKNTANIKNAMHIWLNAFHALSEYSTSGMYWNSKTTQLFVIVLEKYFRLNLKTNLPDIPNTIQLNRVKQVAEKIIRGLLNRGASATDAAKLNQIKVLMEKHHISTVTAPPPPLPLEIRKKKRTRPTAPPARPQGTPSVSTVVVVEPKKKKTKKDLSPSEKKILKTEIDGLMLGIINLQEFTSLYEMINYIFMHIVRLTRTNKHNIKHVFKGLQDEPGINLALIQLYTKVPIEPAFDVGALRLISKKHQIHILFNAMRMISMSSPQDWNETTTKLFILLLPKYPKKQTDEEKDMLNQFASNIISKVYSVSTDTNKKKMDTATRYLTENRKDLTALEKEISDIVEDVDGLKDTFIEDINAEPHPSFYIDFIFSRIMGMKYNFIDISIGLRRNPKVYALLIETYEKMAVVTLFDIGSLDMISIKNALHILFNAFNAIYTTSDYWNSYTTNLLILVLQKYKTISKTKAEKEKVKKFLSELVPVITALLQTHAEPTTGIFLKRVTNQQALLLKQLSKDMGVTGIAFRLL